MIRLTASSDFVPLAKGLLAVLAPSILLTSCFSCEQWRQEEVLNREWHGVVVEVQDLSESCEGRVVLQPADTLDGCNCGLGDEFWRAIDVGDSLVKQKGQTRITVSRSEWTKSFDFPCCDH